MALPADVIVQILLRERLRVTTLAAAIARDGHVADDIFQQVVLAALENGSHFKGHDHVLPWALRAARHRALDYAKSKQLRPFPDEVLDLLEAPAEGDSPWSDQGEALHHCLNRLTSSARTLLQLKYGEGLTAAAIAARLNRTADAVYQSLSRIHKLLRECVQTRLGLAPTAANAGREGEG
ncbi:MAG: sigma-70 family RNA polymerase sigma factor [Gemmataceae bacterium]|nr:sigma-70 family RNA polymerase sigma factor [Gemmata sp.]MDW8196242.1 sigma-70 family RNA polymerase sigma factor [Gemmataceae bacterium]